MCKRFSNTELEKCASSSFQSVFKNFQRFKGIETLVPLFGAFGGGYPAPMAKF